MTPRAATIHADEEYGHGITLADETAADDRQLEAYEAAMADVMTGAGPFWIADGEQHAEWDHEQEFAIARACRDALRNSKLTNGERWHLVMDTILEEGAKCAEHTAERAR